ncbi:MAG: adenylate/guanylate cyclase domain-containing protein [Deltaproteobacteria bacterium]|nr:adenylate/guanylate cyclase domain-containing protein [Deltaproteobacteria bacterium]MBW2534049.1 adenylate/guanylate cyclase domain-containing protein [Deltaproteobacteria bacterium]
MSKLTALLILALMLLAGFQAEADPLTGDPYAAPLPLAGTWRAVPGDLTPAHADAADLASWHPVEVPGKWAGTELEKHRGLAWYGLDVKLEPCEPVADAGLALLLPPFLLAYEVYVNGQLIGASGRIEPVLRGPNRHRIFVLPPELSTASSLRLRVRVHALGFVGTFSAARPEGVALGPLDAIAEREELVAERIAELPNLRITRTTRAVYFGISLLTLLIFLFDRRRQEFGWFALTLLSGIAADFLAEQHVLGADWHGPTAMAVQTGMGALTMSAYFKLLTVLLDLSGKRVTAAILVPWGTAPLAVLVVVAPHMFLQSRVLVPGVYTFFAIASPLVGLVLIAMGRRARWLEARILAVGYGTYLTLTVVGLALAGAGGWQLAGGSAELRASLQAGAQFAFLGTTAVVLALRYHRAFRNVERAHQASERFVPAAFLELLGRKNVVEVERGDSRAQQMSVLFSDIRGFTARSERRTPEQVFSFINRYLERMEPHITEHGGFINQYFGDGIMALFPSPDGALRAARAMQLCVDTLSEDLEQQGEPGIRVGVGVHTGPLMLGTLGGSRRLDTNVIGDAVNLAARIEGMTKKYGCRVLLSEATVAALEHPGEFELREVDTNRAVGRAEPMAVFQLLDAEEPSARETLRAVLHRFARGLAHYRRGAFDAALAEFDEVLVEVYDGPARWLRARCQACLATPPAAWDGVTVLESK